ncbi:MAG TPA: very short patch repair endonuclease [Caulobacteraceae bacterium]
MADSLTPTRRSWNMSRIRGRDTKPETRLRSMLHRAGFRFRLHPKNLPGRPDIVMPKYKTAIMVHGCFWHRHPGCRNATTPTTRREFWQAKFDANVYRDRKVEQQLVDLGWRVITVWECELKKEPEQVVERIGSRLGGGL